MRVFQAQFRFVGWIYTAAIRRSPAICDSSDLVSQGEHSTICFVLLPSDSAGEPRLGEYLLPGAGFGNDADGLKIAL